MEQQDGPQQPSPGHAVFLREAALRSFADPVDVRDPGDGGRPHLARARVGGANGLLARGPFHLEQRYRVSKEQGIGFCIATSDSNPLHRDGDVVPGAYTAAKLLLALEVLFPGLECRRVDMKFTAVATYGRLLVSEVRCVPDAAGARFRAVIAEEGRRVAAMEVRAAPRAPAAAPSVPRRKVDIEQVRRVRSFIRSLGILPSAWLRRAEPGRGAYDLYYPRAFLAALPSGEMVRQLQGDGGLLNKLTLDFDEAMRVPITCGSAPLVELQRPKRPRSTFNKILTAIKDGVVTYVRGTALVLSSEAAAARSGRPRGLAAPGAGLVEASEPPPG